MAEGTYYFIRVISGGNTSRACNVENRGRMSIRLSTHA